MMDNILSGRGRTEEEAILLTLRIRYGDDAEKMRETKFQSMSLGEVCRVLNSEDDDNA